MAKTPLIAGLRLSNRVLRLKGVSVWSVTREDLNDASLTVLLHFARRAAPWPRALMSLTQEGIQVRPVYESNGRVALLAEAARLDSPTTENVSRAIDRATSRHERFFFNSGWMPNALSLQSSRSTKFGFPPTHRGLLLAISAIAVLATLLVVSVPKESPSSIRDVVPSHSPSPSALGEYVPKFTAEKALAEMPKCFAKLSGQMRSEDFPLQLLVECLNDQGKTVLTAKQIAVGGISKLHFRFAEDSVVVQPSATRVDSTWRLDP